MKIGVQRWIDRWVGSALCLAVSCIDAVARRLWPAPAALPAPRAIVVILLSEMGSLVLAHDMFTRLRKRYPQATLHAMVFRKNREILDLMQLIDPRNVHGVDASSLPRFAITAGRALLELRRAGVDIAIDCELFSRVSSLLSYFSGARLRVGFHSRTQEGLYRGSFMNRPVPYNPYQHISNQFIGLARAIESEAEPLSKLPPVGLSTVPPQVPLEAGAVAAMGQRLRRDFPSLWTEGAARPLVLVYPGGGLLPIRAWPVEHYAQVCRELMAEGCAVAVIGLPEDHALAQQLIALTAPAAAAGTAAPCINLTGYTASIRELLALFHNARLLITNDGGPGHFAVLTPITTIMLFGPETPSLYAPRAPNAHTFYADWPCSPCLSAYNHRNTYCDGDNQCLKQIPAAAVGAKAHELLGLRRTQEVAA
ncbi:glycosyltransferase family 9 protein [Rivibacter subsaxonicus]|uniref:ADP-heptose:LPS heptosyltransferase n=1 Tax=Rivibacter subsaxonicus TaxID=457575 RepID=A0A4Q7VG33_9BURK|nr:glycosyltransferase family 9 protein [Rivibacter subsaxonicus]RZT94954.1 ADP-heptose:LPS heptosyltransferase [Rivibacter subsaxonicus]